MKYCLNPLRRILGTRKRLVVAVLVSIALLVAFCGSHVYHVYCERMAQRCFDELVSTSSDSHTYRDAEYKRLLACGERCVVPVVVDALEGGDISPRYQPAPIDILREFPRAAKLELRRRLSEGRVPRYDERFSEFRNRGIVLERRSCLVYGLIAVSNDWMYFDKWLSEAQLPERKEWMNGESPYAMNLEVRSKLEKMGAPHFLFMADPFDWRVNPEFIKWWSGNKVRVIEQSSKSGDG